MAKTYENLIVLRKEIDNNGKADANYSTVYLLCIDARPGCYCQLFFSKTTQYVFKLFQVYVCEGQKLISRRYYKSKNYFFANQREKSSKIYAAGLINGRRQCKSGKTFKLNEKGDLKF